MGKREPLLTVGNVDWCNQYGNQYGGPYGPAIPLLGIYPKKIKVLIWKAICTPMFIASSLTKDKIWKIQYPSIYEWIKKLWHIYYAAINIGNIAICDVMDLEGYMLSKIRQKNKYCMIFHICKV